MYFRKWLLCYSFALIPCIAAAALTFWGKAKSSQEPATGNVTQVEKYGAEDNRQMYSSPTVENVCLDGWLLYDESCFIFKAIKANSTTADQICKLIHNARLAEIYGNLLNLIVNDDGNIGTRIGNTCIRNEKLEYCPPGKRTYFLCQKRPSTSEQSQLASITGQIASPMSNMEELGTELQRIMNWAQPTFLDTYTDDMVIVNEHQPIELNCIAKGHPMPTIQWFKNNLTVARGPKLKISSADKNDSGTYKCVASNQVGPTKEKTFVVKINHKPKVKLQPKTISAIIGRSIELNCIADGHPEPQYKWMFNGTQLTKYKSRLFSKVSGASIEIEMSKDNLGTYTCIAKNSVGESSDTVEVRGPTPKIVHIEQDASCKDQKGNVVLTFLIKSEPESDVLNVTYGIVDSEYSWIRERFTGLIAQDSGNPSLDWVKKFKVSHVQYGFNYIMKAKAKNEFGWGDEKELRFKTNAYDDYKIMCGLSNKNDDESDFGTKTRGKFWA